LKILITTVPFRNVKLLENAGLEFHFNPLGRRLTEKELIQLISDFHILIAGTEPITAKVMDAAPHLKLIARVGIGLDSVDLEAARRRGIAVTYTPDAPAPAVAELTVGLMLDLLRGISCTDRAMHTRQWNRVMGRRLNGLTVGIVGVGRVGKRVTRILRGGFPDVHILANDIQPDYTFGKDADVRWVEKSELYVKSDIVTLHVPLTRATRRLLGEREISAMKNTGFVINTSRGEIVDESALAAALKSGRLAGAAIDVFEEEPYAGVLTDIERCILTCHMGSMSEDCRHAMETEAVDDVLRFVRREPLKQPVPEVEYLGARN
jgi:D-3-phosphoglycerate dehydrogenase / 2-oxoglutarate reductase